MLGLGLDKCERLLLKLQAPALHVHPEYCSRLRHKNSKCALCSDNCPTRAIEWTTTLSVDPDNCTSCGICASTCPNGVFEAVKPTDGEILEKVKLLLDGQQEIIFGCAKAPESQIGLLRVPCLARLNEAVLVGSIALGARSVWLVNEFCQGCEYESSYCVTERAMSVANEILAPFGLSQSISFLKEKLKVEPVRERPEKPVITSRREFLRSIARETKKAGALIACSMVDSYTYPDADKPKRWAGKLPKLLPMKRRLLLSSMKRIGGLIDGASETESQLFCQFKINENCTGCQMCAFFCPTGALVNVEEEGKTGVRFKISDCTACGLCQEICYKQAIRLPHRVDLYEVVEGHTEVVIMRDKPFAFPDNCLGEVNVLK